MTPFAFFGVTFFSVLLLCVFALFVYSVVEFHRCAAAANHENKSNKELKTGSR